MESTEQAAQGLSTTTALLRFAHAETVLPLVSLMRLPGCSYTGSDLGNLKLHWADFSVVPMAANLQVVLYKGPSGQHYATVLLNEKAVAPIQGDSRTIVPWSELRDYWLSLAK